MIYRFKLLQVEPNKFKKYCQKIMEDVPILWPSRNIWTLWQFLIVCIVFFYLCERLFQGYLTIPAWYGFFQHRWLHKQTLNNYSHWKWHQPYLLYCLCTVIQKLKMPFGNWGQSSVLLFICLVVSRYVQYVWLFFSNNVKILSH